jgi:hypothetical protein
MATPLTMNSDYLNVLLPPTRRDVPLDAKEPKTCLP